jgi:Bacterial archaeo-eukaryotic release factor family 7
MILLSKAELNELIERSGFPCVSMYLPTHRVTAHNEQDPIRLKNLMQQAEERLASGGLRTSEVTDLLGPARRLYEDNHFWRHQSDGLAIFLAPGFARHYSLPVEFTDTVVVAERLYLKPLLPLLTGDGRFYILAISQDRVRLLEGTRHSVVEVELEGLPESLAQALRADDPEKQLQFHTRAPDRVGERRDAVFHGHGQAHGEDEKDRLLRYFRKIDQGMWELLRDEKVPLVLAGVEYYLPIYREANRYPHLVEEVIPGNPEGVLAEELHRQAWEILKPQFREEQENAKALYRQFAGTGRTSSNLREIVPAAHHGRVGYLFVALGQQRWGSFDPANNVVETHEQAKPGDHDLLDLAAVEAFSNRATVFAVEPSAVPAATPIAAVFRY